MSNMVPVCYSWKIRNEILYKLRFKVLSCQKNDILKERSNLKNENKFATYRNKNILLEKGFRSEYIYL